MLTNSPGIADAPTKRKTKILYFGLYPTGWREKWNNVPRDVADEGEDLVGITKFTKKLYTAEQKSGKRISDGGTLKRSEAITSSKGDKSGDKTTSKKAKGTKLDGTTAQKKVDGM